MITGRQGSPPEGPGLDSPVHAISGRRKSRPTLRLHRTVRPIASFGLALILGTSATVLHGGAPTLDKEAAASRQAEARAATDQWPAFRGDPQLRGSSAGDLPRNLKPVWTFQAEGGIESTAAIQDGSVYVGSLDGHLYCLSLDAGVLKWKYAAGAPIKSSPTVYDGTVYFGDENGAFHAVDLHQGRRRWLFQTDAAVVSSAALASGRVIFGSNDSHLYAVSTGDGTLAWKIQTGGYVYGTPAVAEGFGEAAVVSAGCDGFLRVLRARDGVELRKLDLGAYVGASPAVGRGRAYVGTFENQFLGIDLEAAKVLWSYEHPERKFPFYASAALGEGIVVVGGRDKMVHALRLDTGAAKWTYPAGAKVDASPVIVKDRVIVATTAGDLIALSLASGEMTWQFETGSSIVASPSLAAGRLLIGTTGGLLYAFGGK